MGKLEMMGKKIATNGSQRSGGIQVIARAMSILRLLENNPKGLSLGAIAREIGLARSTVQRIVHALATERLLVSGPSGTGVRLGPGLVSLGSAARSHFHSVIRPHLKSLSFRLEETVDLSIRDGQVAVFIDQAISEQRRLRAVSAVGLAFSLHCCANGKAFLAGMDGETLQRMLRRLDLKPATPNTITSKKRLLEELEAVRREGFAYDREEQTLGICAVGAIVSDPFDGQLAISVAVPTTRFYGNEQVLGQTLLECCKAVDADLSDAV